MNGENPQNASKESHTTAFGGSALLTLLPQLKETDPTGHLRTALERV